MLESDRVQTGRASLASQEVAPVDGGLDVIPRPAPPADLNDEERDEWITICNAVPATYFPQAMHMIVVQYCRHVVVARHLAELIHRVSKRKRLDEARFRRLIKEQRAETLAVYGCLRSMRLTHLATYARDRTPMPVETPKPWLS